MHRAQYRSQLTVGQAGQDPAFYPGLLELVAGWVTFGWCAPGQLDRRLMPA